VEGQTQSARDWRVDYMREAIARVAATPEDQIRWMDSPDGGDSDELFCTLDDARDITRYYLAEAGVWTPEVASAVQAIYDEFESWNDHSLWTSDEALRRPEWNRVREVARRALALFDAAAPPWC
jgi:hypothetical protein